VKIRKGEREGGGKRDGGSEEKGKKKGKDRRTTHTQAYQRDVYTYKHILTHTQTRARARARAQTHTSYCTQIDPHKRIRTNAHISTRS